MPKHVDPPRFIRLPQVLEMTGLSTSTIYRWMTDGTQSASFGLLLNGLVICPALVFVCSISPLPLSCSSHVLHSRRVGNSGAPCRIGSWVGLSLLPLPLFPSNLPGLLPPQSQGNPWRPCLRMRSPSLGQMRTAKCLQST